MTDPNDINPEDSQLFRTSVGSVKPLRRPRVLVRNPRPAPRPRQTEQDQNEVLQEMARGQIDLMEVETGEELSYRRPGIQAQLFKRLRRGQFVIEAELDLHGLTSIEAKTALTRFLSACLAANRRCARIIHGKGRGSRDGKAVLKNKLNTWLRTRDEVLAFCSARLADGGTGAVYVLLRQQKQS